ncbi:hypothetical protein JCM10212_003532 [Sporobolomyces blumeae]
MSDGSPLATPPPHPPTSSGPSRTQRGSSAFSRLANIALSSSNSTTSSTSSSPASAPVPALRSAGSSTAPRALDALETIAFADQGRKRHGSSDSRVGDVVTSTAGSTGNVAAGTTTPGGASASSILGAASSTRISAPYGQKRGSWANRDSSASRSRERERSDASSSAFAASGGSAPGFTDSPGAVGGGLISRYGGGGFGSAYWGSEPLPANASYSAFSSFAGASGFSLSMVSGDSHYFQPGAGASGFSFEAGGGGSGPFWDGSYRSSTTGSSSLFGPSSRSQGSYLGDQSSSDDSRLNVLPLDLPTTSPYRSRPHSPSIRTSSPMGGGRKPKDSSRGLRFSVASSARDKGLVGLAKPPKDSEQGRVAVAGKSCLKILKVPHGPSTRTFLAPVPPPSTSHHRSTSIADRRSRSRGRGPTASPVGRRNDSVDPVDADERSKAEEVTEIVDVRTGSRLGPSYLFSDVRWGYGATSNKLATACTNGAVVLWDLAREGSKLDQVKYEHDRAVNRVVFGGQTGNWLMSGGQDGQMKLWDIRETRPSSMILKASSPVRHLSFSPSASQPFTLLAACASGTLIRYDVRYISRQNGGATDRIAGHIGSCLAMDWRDGYDCERVGVRSGEPTVGVSQETAGGGREGGWVVTGGIDSTIKIWDFSLATLSTKPVRTLYPSQAVQSVTWHPTRGTELASSPLPSLISGGDNRPGEEAPPTTPVQAENPMNAFLRGETGGATRGDNWKNEIAVWDTRRPYFPKMAIKTEEPTSSILFNDDDTIWATSKTSTTFLQHDTASDSYSLLDCIDRPAVAWNLDGDLVFVDDSRTQHDVPFERTRKPVPVDSAKFVPEVYFASVLDLDPDFSSETFVQLANDWRLTGDFDEICEHNAHASMMAGRPDAAQMWTTVRTWFGKDPFSAPNSPPMTPLDRQVDLEKVEPAVPKAPDWILSPTSITHSEAAARANRGQRFSISSSMRNSPTSRRQGSDDTYVSSRNDLPKENVRQILDTFSEESTASETDPSSTQSPFYPDVVSTSSDSEVELRSTARSRHHSASIAGLPTNRLAASLAALADAQNGVDSSGSSSVDEVQRKPSRTPTRLQSRRNSSSSSSSDTSSDSDNGDEGSSKAPHRSRSAKIAALHASLIANRSRRPSAGQSSERRPLRSRDSTLAAARGASRQHSAEGATGSRRESAARTGGTRVASMSATMARKDTKEAGGQTTKELNREASNAFAASAFEVVKSQLKATLAEYADRGDSQLCATVCCVLQDRDIELDSLWVARVTKAYLDLLRNHKLHVAAATLNKYCATESLRSLTQGSVVFHTACGRCGKGIEQAPFDFCPRCTAQITKCSLCHLAATSLYVLCATCGHGAHEHCLQAFLGSLGTSLAASQPQTPMTTSVPSTPGIATPLRAWLWGEPLSPILDDGEDLDGFAAADKLATLLSQCPSGSCSHACKIPSHFAM